MERVAFKKDLFFAIIIAMAIHAGVAFTHIYSPPQPLHFKAKKYDRLIISIVSMHTEDVVPVAKKEKKVIVEKEKEINKPDKKIEQIRKKEIITESSSLKKVEIQPVSPSVSVGSHSSVPTGEESLETTKATLAIPRYGENVPPVYPTIARRRGYKGVVLLSAEVLIDGRVGKLKIKESSGYHILDKSALKAVEKWRFEPAKRMGCSITMWVEVPVRFVLRDK